MTAEKTQAPADPGVSVTLYKAVTATVTWEQVRTAAKAMGMRLTKLEGAEDIEAWVHDSGRRIYIGGDANDMGHEIETLARIAGTSPGEMLQRIVGPANDPRTPYDGVPPEGMSACLCGRAFCAGNGVAISVGAKWQNEPISQRAVNLAQRLSSSYTWSSTSYAQHGDDEALRVGPGWMGVASEVLRLEYATRKRWREEERAYQEADAKSQAPSYPGAVPWRSRAHVSAVIQALVYRDATDTQAADFLAAHLEDIWADYMRRLTLEPVPMKFVSPTAQKAVEDMRDRCAEVAEQFPITDGATAQEGTRDLAIAAAIRAQPLTAEPTGARVSDETCHPGAAVASPVTDASAELRARLVAELHAAGRPKLADRMSVDVRWRSLVDFVNPEILDMLSESLRKDIKTEVPK